MRTRATMLSAVATVLLVPTLLTACSSSPDGADAPTANDGQVGLALASCMRDHGYDFADPDSGAPAQLSVPEGVDPDAYQADLKECLASGPVADSGAKAQQLPGAAERERAYGECIVEAGFDDFPDDSAEWADYVPADQGAFDAASDACGAEIFSDIDANQAG